MGKLYTTQPITVTLTCTVDGGDLSSATSAVIAYQAPNGTTGEWAGTLDTGAGTVAYEVTASDVALHGKWKLQPVITFADGKVVPGETVTMPIYERFA
jgi:hypothetical protein